MDDGAENLQTSIKLCLDSYKNGCDDLVLTPHFFEYDDISVFIEERNEKIKILRKALKDKNIPLRLHAGAELFLNDDIFEAGNLDGLTINGTKYMLCELSLLPFDTRFVTRWFENLIDRGYTPILAHPERYYEIHRDYNLLEDLIDREILFQVNLDSLIGLNGPESQDLATDMVRRGFAQFIASDAHDLQFRHTRLIEKLNELPDIITEKHVETCLIHNPQKLLNNEEIKKPTF
jgi:protein-tyrosine phosphatase